MDNWCRLTDEYGRGDHCPSSWALGRDGMLLQDFQLSIFRTPNLASPRPGHAYQPRMMASQMVPVPCTPNSITLAAFEGGYDDPEYCAGAHDLVGKMPFGVQPGRLLRPWRVIDLMKRGTKLVTRPRASTGWRPDQSCSCACATARTRLSRWRCATSSSPRTSTTMTSWERWTYGFDEFKERVAWST